MITSTSNNHSPVGGLGACGSHLVDNKSFIVWNIPDLFFCIFGLRKSARYVCCVEGCPGAEGNHYIRVHVPGAKEEQTVRYISFTGSGLKSSATFVLSSGMCTIFSFRSFVLYRLDVSKVIFVKFLKFWDHFSNMMAVVLVNISRTN